MVRLLNARIVTGFTVWLQFSDGTEGHVDLWDELHGPLFEPLQNPSVFVQMRVDPEIDTITWPNGADFAPDFLYQKVKLAAA